MAFASGRPVLHQHLLWGLTLSSRAVFGMSSCASFEQSAKMGDSGATILVKLDRADKMRTNARGEAPDPMAKFRITVGACSLR